jgi:creatinine amidohydrolase
MRVEECNWMQLEAYLEGDDRIVLPLGSTEQHGYLSLATDSILSERVAAEAAEPLGVPVLPALPYGLTPYFGAYPGSPSLRMSTYLAVVGDLLDSLHGQGFRRFLVVNGHGGNAPAGALALEWMARNDGQVLFHNWWNGPRTWAAVQSIDPDAGHASWLENFPWTRLAGVVLPTEKKPMADLRALAVRDPTGVRELLGDGSFGGLYERSDDEMLALWRAGVEEVRELLVDGWRDG